MQRDLMTKQNALTCSNNYLAESTMLDRLCERLFKRKLKQISIGCIELHESQKLQLFGDKQSADKVVVEVIDIRLYRRLLFGGSVGAGEAYMEGWWRCDDLTTLIRLIIANEELLAGLDRGYGRLLMPLYRIYHRRRKNTRMGSRQNIIAHYDLGNDFYATFLDPTMAYSAAVFPSQDASLEEGSTAKFERICRKLELQESDHLLEIGTGWGGFALYAAQTYGCKITTVTISKEQFSFARQRIEDAGLADRVLIEYKDYRDIRGVYDKLVCIEMFEAVGHEFHDTFFKRCSSLLKPTGMLLLQSITIRDQAYENYRQEVDFIRRYIFPGGCLPSLTAIMCSLAKVTDMTVFHLEDIGPHYARTLAHWRDAFFKNIDKVREMAMSERFIRMWEFYLCYCEAGFLERYLGDLQLLLVKPQARPEPLLPELTQNGTKETHT